MPRWDRDLAARLIARHKVSHWTCIPTMIIDLFASPNVAGFDLKSLRYLSGGGAAMPHAVAERLKRDFNITFAEGYGLTETAAPTHANLPERAMRQQISSAINVVCQQTRLSDGSRRVTTISEITGMEGDIITMQDIFIFEKTGLTPENKVMGRFRATGVRPKCWERLRAAGINLPPEMFSGSEEVR